MKFESKKKKFILNLTWVQPLYNSLIKKNNFMNKFSIYIIVNIMLMIFPMNPWFMDGWTSNERQEIITTLFC